MTADNWSLEDNFFNDLAERLEKADCAITGGKLSLVCMHAESIAASLEFSEFCYR